MENVNLEVVDLKPRHYQQQLLEVCMAKNTIIYLPTGAGKTLVAVMAIKRMAKELQLPLSQGGKRTFFMVNTIALAKQQAEFISKITPFTVQAITSERNVDGWKQFKWLQEIDNNQVIVCTSQVLLDVLKQNYLKVHQINLVIFDECHIARNNHPMHGIMGQLQYCRKKDQPRVIGLSGMLLNNTNEPYTVKDDLLTLENTFQSTIATAGSYDEYNNILEFSTNPEEKIMTYCVQPQTLTAIRVKGMVEQFLKTIKNLKMPSYSDISKVTLQRGVPSPIKKVSKLFRNFLSQMEDLGIYGASIAILGVIVELELKKRKSSSQIERSLMRTSIAEAEKICHILTVVMDGCTVRQKVEKFSTQKVAKLIDFIATFCVGHKASEIKSLVFVQERFSAKCVYHLLQIYLKAIGNEEVKPDFMVGNSARMPESIEAILESMQNKRVVEKFRKGETNLIVTTSVLEEGMDLQMCNLVIKYDPPNSFRSYVQSKGRARMRNSVYLMVCDTNKQSALTGNIRRYKSIEEELKRCLVGQTINRPEPLSADVHRELCRYPIEPVMSKTGAILDAVSCVHLLNKYVMSLPKDEFCNGACTWKRENLCNDKIKVSLFLPLQSTVKEMIEGDPAITIKMAKRSVAFKACVRLYQNGELGEDFRPVDTTTKLMTMSDKYFKYGEEESKSCGRDSVSRRYDMEYPGPICHSTPEPLKNCYIYILKMESKVDRSYNSANNFGIMMGQPIPQLAKFQLFAGASEIDLEIATDGIQMLAGSREELFLLRKFHVMIFRDLLKVWKPFFAFDCTPPTKNSFLIVPMKNSETIDWDLVQQFQRLSTPSAKDVEMRNGMMFNMEEYRDKVVHPWYLTEKDRNYVGTNVRLDLSPLSKHPNPAYETYAQFIEKTYNVPVVHKEQFLIEAKRISTNLNRLSPSDDGAEEFLLPELCYKFEFPVDYWLKATLLPSALHRFTYLLFAEDMRCEFADLVGIGCIENHSIEALNADLKPSSLDESTSVKKTIKVKSELPWEGEKEPMDLQRNWNNVSKDDIDEFTSFTTKFDSMRIGERMIEEEFRLLTLNALRAEVPIAPIVDDDKAKIKLLRLNLENTRSINLQQQDLMRALIGASEPEAFNMDRFVMLGSAFLTFSASCYLVKNHKDWHGGYIGACIEKIRSNYNLMKCGEMRDVPRMVYVQKFMPHQNWPPPLLTVPGIIRSRMAMAEQPANLLNKLVLSEEEVYSGQLDPATFRSFEQFYAKTTSNDASDMDTFLSLQSIPTKTVADIMNALLGVCVKTVGVERSFKFFTHFEILPKDDLITTLMKDKIVCPRVHAYIRDAQVDEFLINYNTVQKKLGYVFGDRAYLLQALTHSSYDSNRLTESYEKLILLGYATLDFLISCHIFEQCPHLTPSQLKNLRVALTDDVLLASILVRNYLHLYILADSAGLTDSILKFVAFQEENEHAISEPVRLLLKDGILMGDYVDVPKVLRNIFASLIGAVFLDSGNDLEVTWRVVHNFMHEEISKYKQKLPQDSICQLYEFPRAFPKFRPVVVDDDVLSVNLQFTWKNQQLTVHGFGKNTADAKKAAAHVALRKLMDQEL